MKVIGKLKGEYQGNAYRHVFADRNDDGNDKNMFGICPTTLKCSRELSVETFESIVPGNNYDFYYDRFGKIIDVIELD